jgi:hypothetical protein
MAGRPLLRIGQHGKVVREYLGGGVWLAGTRCRDADGVTRRVQRLAVETRRGSAHQTSWSPRRCGVSVANGNAADLSAANTGANTACRQCIRPVGSSSRTCREGRRLCDRAPYLRYGADARSFPFG